MLVMDDILTDFFKLYFNKMLMNLLDFRRYSQHFNTGPF